MSSLLSFRLRYLVPVSLLVGVVLMLVPIFASAATLKVGPNETYKKPSEAYAKAVDGDVIEIAAGTYINDALCIRKNNITFRGVGGLAHFKLQDDPATTYRWAPTSREQGCGEKGALVAFGTNLTFENLEVSGAIMPDKTGAGIRLGAKTASTLTVRNSYFHNNDNGMLGGYAGTEVLVENSEFGFNGACDGYSHGVYFAAIDKLTIRNSYFHDTCIGHNVKTRSRITYLLGNRITDEAGDPSFDIDISGGRAYVIGNMIEKSVKAENPSTMLNFYTVRDPIGPHELYVINNTFVSGVTVGGYFVRVRSVDIPTFAKVVNNIFVGSPRYGMVVAPNAIVENNLRYPLLADAKLTNIAGYDYRLTADSEAINAGVNPGIANGFSLTPTLEYVHPAKGAVRTVLGPVLDVGAFEFAGTPTRLYPLPTLNLTSKFSTIDNSSDISWDTNGSSCIGSGGAGSWTGTKSARGTFNTGPVTQNTIYTLVCTRNR